jgi:hypothetical protein
MVSETNFCTMHTQLAMRGFLVDVKASITKWKMSENGNQVLQYVSTANSQNPVHIKYTSENMRYQR